MLPDTDKTIRVAPRKGRTVRFPAGHPLQGERIPAAEDTPGGAGTKVPRSAHYIRSINCGDLVVVRSGRRVKGPVSSKAPGLAGDVAEARESAGSPVDWPALSRLRKAELVELAEAAGVEVEGKNAEELREELQAVKDEAEEAAGDAAEAVGEVV